MTPKITLHPPFAISARLLPAVRIETAWLSYDGNCARFVLDMPDGSEHWITDFSPGAGAGLADQFSAILSFLGACAESRQYATRQGKDPMEGENSDLFPANVGEWAESVSDELAMLSCEIEESETELIEA